MDLNAAQKQAVEYLDGPLLVLAGPGTGKTQLLSAKVAYILENTDTNPDNILCITFTDNGADTMRRRLISKVGPAGSHVKIGTYHSFGSDLLYAYQNYATTFNRQLLEPISPVAKFKIINDIVSSLPARDILHGDNVDNIISTISEAKSANLSPADLLKIAAKNNADTAKINPEIAKILETPPSRKFEIAVQETYLPLLEIFTKYTSKDPIVGRIEPLANHLVRDLNHIIESEQQKDKPSVKSLTDWRNKITEKAPDGTTRLANVVKNLKLESLANIYAAYADHLAKNGLFDFDDMIGEAIKILKTDAGFRLTLSEKYQYILLDEFQDTNPAQFELIRLLTDYENPVVMAVGDDDQAIFAFQGANASNLLDFQNHYNAKVITLTKNYRSTQDILDLSRHVADQMTDSFAKQYGTEKTLTAENTTLSRRNIARHVFASSDAEYYWVANEIKNLIDSGVSPKEIAVIAPRHKTLIPLLPYLKQHDNIPIAYEKRDNLFEDPALSKILNLARFVYELADETLPSHRALEILTYPFWEIPPIEAIRATVLARENHRDVLGVIADSDNPRLNFVANFIAELVQLSYDTPLERFVDYLIGATPLPSGRRSPFLDFYTKNPELLIDKDDSSADENSANTPVKPKDFAYTTFEFYENLNTLRSELRDYTNNPSAKLKDLIAFLDDYELAGAPLTSKSPYQEAASAVHLLSVHKSKGDEFAYVFLISFDDYTWGKAKGGRNMLALPINLVHIRHVGDSPDELLRNLFVALTRAKTDLILTSSKSNFTGKALLPLAYLAETDEISPYLPKDQQKLIYHLPETIEEVKQNTDLRAHWLENYTTLTPDLESLLLTRLEKYRFAATHLTSFIDLQYSGPQAFYREHVICEPQPPASPIMQLGTHLHATFDQITKQHLDETAALDFYNKQIREKVADVDQAQLLEIGENAIKVALKTFGDLLYSKNAVSELSFRRNHLTFGDVRLTGQIDHIEVDKKNKTLEIYDFKTSKHHVPGAQVGWNADTALIKYRLQLEFYRLLLKSSPEYQNYEIPRAHILFIKPDADNEVYQETYEFDPTYTANFEKLVKNTFQLITSLEFVNHPYLFLPTNSETKKSDVLNFIETLINWDE